jgi:hypothetical protein
VTTIEPRGTRRAEGILLLYHYAPPYAATVLEHVNAFARHSKYAVWPVNVENGYPPALDRLDPAVIVLHYSLFGSSDYFLKGSFLRLLDRADASYRVAFFQDEYYYCQQRFAFIDRYDVNCVYTLVEDGSHSVVYGAHTHGPATITTIPGYVSDDLPRLSNRFSKPDAQRRIDIGYRARRLPFYMGRGAQEKHRIGIRFQELAQPLGLTLDIETGESSRLYGDSWYRFLGDCRAVLGVEAGVSIFDLDDRVRQGYERLIAESPEMTFDEMSKVLLGQFEDNLPYRTVSPRHFEAAAFRVTQILFEGRYSGVLEPMAHYLPLRKDFGNFDEIIRLYRNPQVRESLTSRAYDDLIASGRWSYAAFIEGFDAHLERANVVITSTPEAGERVRTMLQRGGSIRELKSASRRRYRRWADGATGRRIRRAVRRLIRRRP